jgi:hypothetical protein
MENSTYKLALMEIISLIKDKATYLKSIDSTSKEFNPDFYSGMAMSYFFVLDGIKTYIESTEMIDADGLGLKDFNPEEILQYKPLHYKE